MSLTEITEIHRKDYSQWGSIHFLQMMSFNLPEDFMKASFQSIFCQIKTFIL